MQKNKGEILQAPYQRVLIARFTALGDVAMTIPVIYSVCRENPGTRFLMLTQRVASQLFINAPENLQVMGINTTDYKGIGGLYRLYKEIKRNFNPQAFVDLHGVIRTYVLGAFFTLFGVKVQHIDKGRAGKRALTRRRGKRLLPLISSRARYREVFHRVGFEFKYEFTSLFGKEKAPQESFAEITPPRTDLSERWIAIAPFANHKGKIYPLEKMEQVVAVLSRRPDVK
ncbi:MAG: glycosyl transferase family 1, partial [Muribaculaceae bacterium]|nr:glycosyl transferase family 1 [Muribaculaceae bacterium]